MASSMHAALNARHTAYNCREGTLASVFRSMGEARSTRPAMPSWPRQRGRLGTNDPKPGDESPHTGIAPGGLFARFPEHGVDAVETRHRPQPVSCTARAARPA